MFHTSREKCDSLINYKRKKSIEYYNSLTRGWTRNRKKINKNWWLCLRRVDPGTVKLICRLCPRSPLTIGFTYLGPKMLNKKVSRTNSSNSVHWWEQWEFRIPISTKILFMFHTSRGKCDSLIRYNRIRSQYRILKFSNTWMNKEQKKIKERKWQSVCCSRGLFRGAQPTF